jgi:hypothetical protein
MARGGCVADHETGDEVRDIHPASACLLAAYQPVDNSRKAPVRPNLPLGL